MSRPRDTTIDERALAATRELLESKGFEATTMQAIAVRADLHTSALYRRWPSRIEVIAAAVFPGLETPAVAPTGDLRVDIRRFLQTYIDAFGRPAARAAIPNLLAHYNVSGQTPGPGTWLPVSARPHLVDIIAAAPVGSVDGSVDPEDVFDVLLGAVYARVMVPSVVERDRPLERLVDLAMKMLGTTVSSLESSQKASSGGTTATARATS